MITEYLVLPSTKVYAVLARTYEGGEVLGVFSSEYIAQSWITANKNNHVVGDGKDPDSWCRIVPLVLDMLNPEFIKSFMDKL